jgi:hypothetical protein
MMMTTMMITIYAFQTKLKLCNKIFICMHYMHLFIFDVHVVHVCRKEDRDFTPFPDKDRHALYRQSGKARNNKRKHCQDNIVPAEKVVTSNERINFLKDASTKMDT